MLDTPWDTPQPPLDYPQSAKVISLHRATVVPISVARAARATRDAGMLAALAERAEEIAYDDFVRADGRTRLGTPVEVAAAEPSRDEALWLLLGVVAAGYVLAVVWVLS